MYRVVMPDGTVRMCQTKAEALLLLREMKEAYEGYFN